MALTRTMLLADSRKLRSGYLIARALPPRRVGKSSPLSSPVSKRSRNTSSTRRPRQNNTRNLMVCGGPQRQASGTSILREEDNGQSIDEAGQHLILPSCGHQYQGEDDDHRLGPGSSRDLSNPPSPHLSVPSPIVRHSGPEADGDGASPSLRPRGQAPLIEEDENTPSYLEDVGIPSDELWDQSEAYDLRCCFDHREVEFLLKTPDRWMPAKDFDIPGAEAELEALFQQHQNCPSGFDPHSEYCQAGCYSTLFSQIHSVINKRDIGDEVQYLIRWKVCWTPESCVNEMDWIPASLARNKNPHYRRSERSSKVFESRIEGYRKMLVVVALE